MLAKEMKSAFLRHICTPMLTAALFTTNKCGINVDACPQKIWYTYTMDYCSTIMKNETASFAEK